MGLPKAVQAIGDAAEAQAVELGMKGGDKPAPAAQPAATAEPVKTEQPRIDPENYKERYSRYKATTDATITELRQTLADIQTTLTESQRQNQELIQKLNAAPTVVADPAPVATADPQGDDAYKAWLDKLPQKIKDEYQDDYLRDQFTIQTTAVGQQDNNNAPSDNLKELEQKVGHLESVAMKTEAQLYDEAMDEAFPDDEWLTITRGEDWGNFCAKKLSPVDQRSYGEVVKQGGDTHTATTVIWVLNQFKQYLSDLGAAAPGNAGNELENQLTPEGGVGGDPVQEINAQAETFTITQVNEFFKDRATTKKYTAEQADAIEESIKRAQAAGKIIQG